MSRHASILLRDLVRAARSWQTYGLRVAIAALISAYSLYASLDLNPVDLASLAMQGHDRFVVFALLLLAATALLAPVLVVSALQEERDDHTLELLTLTGLPPLSVLAGKFGSRLVVLLGLVVGALPALAVGLSLGGVGAGELVGAVVASVVVGVILASVAGYYAVHASSMFGPLLATAVWLCGLTAIAGPFWLSSVGVGGQWTVPFLPEGWSWTSLWLLPASAPHVFAVGALTVVAFQLRVATSRSPEDSGRSTPERRGATLAARAVGTLAALTIVLSPVAGVAITSIRTPPGSPNIQPPLLAAVYLHGVFAASLIYLQASAELLARADRGMSWLGRLALGGEARASVWRARRWRLTPLFLDDPTLTRELVTRATGATSVVLGAVTVVGFGLAAMLLPLAVMVLGVRELGVLVSIVGVLVALLSQLVALVLATASVVEERRGDGLEVLFTSTYAPWRWVAAKVVAVASRATPLAVVGMAIMVFGLMLSERDAVDPLLAGAACAVSLLPSQLALIAGAVAIAARVRPVTLAWPAVVGTLVGLVFVSVCGASIVGETGFAVAMSWLPTPVDDEPWVAARLGTAPLYLLFAAVCLGGTAVRLRAWVAASAR
jgi:ABC-type transport system involved in multi-copper enzyme maturation permease subunit